MGIFGAMRRRTQLLSCRIVFDSFNRLGVSVEVREPSISPDEYCRLWANYHVNVLDSLRYPTSVDALLASAVIKKVTDRRFSSGTDCFARAGLSEVVEYTEDSLVGFPDMIGRYYARGQRRFFIIDLPLDVTAKHLIYGSVGLLQFCLNRCRTDQNELDFAHKMARKILFLLAPDSGYDSSDLAQIPDAAYSLAKRS